MNRIPRLLTSLAVAWMACTAGPAVGIEPWQTAVDYQRLLDALGPATPIGAGVAVAQVEAGEGSTSSTAPYMPDANHFEFLATADPLMQAVQVTDGSGAASNGVSGHATVVAYNILGNGFGVAKGANTLTTYDANRWLNDVLRYGGSLAPASQPFRVQNHSWIGTLHSTSSDVAVLQRFDYVIDTDDVTAVVGANNNNGTPTSETLPHPNFLAHSYNAIVAGRSDSKHSRGATTSIYGAGRYRPDLVCDAPSTSVASARISSIATVLRGVIAGSDADRSETMKAILMAGATKSEFASFVDPATNQANPWDRTHTRPLDDLFGAGEVNIYNSYLMTVGGRHEGSTGPPTTAAPSYGWDYQDRKGDSAVGDIYYNFNVPTGSTATELSIVLAWNAKISDSDPGAPFIPSDSLQNLDLRFYNSTASFMGALLDQSISTVDNVEHIFRTNLGPGNYTLRVSGAANWDYGLAWRMATKFNATNADFDGDGAVTGLDFLVWQRNLGTLVGALPSQGDADGDGDVDRDDLSIFTAATATPTAGGLIAGSSSPAGAVNAGHAISGVPEPATGSLAAVAIGGFAAFHGRRRRVWQQKCI